MVPENSEYVKELTEFLNKYMLGKEFMYRSKYGGITKGIVNKFTLGRTITSENMHKEKFGSKQVCIPLPPIYSKQNIIIYSENNISYNLDEIYIKHE